MFYLFHLLCTFLEAADKEISHKIHVLSCSLMGALEHLLNWFLSHSELLGTKVCLFNGILDKKT